MILFQKTRMIQGFLYARYWRQGGAYLPIGADETIQ